MTKTFSSLSLIALLMTGTALSAQETSGTETETETPVSEAVEAVENAASEAEAAVEGAASEVETVVEDAVSEAETAVDSATEAAETTSEEAAQDAEPAAEAEAATEEAAEEAQPASEDAAAEEEGAAPEELDLGQSVAGDQTYIKTTHGDWQLKCLKVGETEELCQMYQLLTEDAGNPVAEFTVFKLADAGPAVAGATVVVPLGTFLSEDLKIAIDGGQAKSYKYSFCSVTGCYARIGFTQDDINAFKRGAQAVMQIVPVQAPDQKVNIRVSLTGFTAAYDETSVAPN